MTHCKNNAFGKIKALSRICICVICSLTLAFSLAPISAYGGGLDDSPDFESGESSSSAAKDVRVADLNGPQSIGSYSLAADTENSVVKLKDTKEVRWYDRVVFPEKLKNTCDKLYRVLAEAVDNDGKLDYLIEDKYINSSMGAPSVPNEFENFRGGYTGIEIGRFEIDDNYNPSSDYDDLYECALVVIAAFDRDHPEVFWLNGSVITFWMPIEQTSSLGNHMGAMYLATGGYKNLNSQLEKEDIRATSFGSEESIKTAIKYREDRTRELLSKVGVEYKGQQESTDQDLVSEVDPNKYSDAEKVRFFNMWLTHSNAYNTLSLDGLSSRYPLAFECISALVGRTGKVGPVCEGYSRAFKVLCDAAGIPCVLSDGKGGGEAHMWNGVSIDGKWYAVDVTWNDPGVGYVAQSGNENENYLLVGSTYGRAGSGVNTPFTDSHKVENRHFVEGFQFENEPTLQEEAYPLTMPESFQDDFDSSDYADIDLSYLDKDVGLSNVSYIPDVTYNTKAICPVPSKVTIGNKMLRQDIDYKLIYGNNVNVGIGYVGIVGIGEYTGSKLVGFNILPASVSVASISISDVVYSGKAQKPLPVVSVTNSDFKENVHYVVETSYSSNVKAGLAYANVVVRGIGNCSGATLHTVEFKILPKRAQIKKLTAKKKSFVVKWKKVTSAQGTGYQIRYSTKKNFKSGVKRVNVGKVSTSQKTIKKLKKKKRYYVSMRVYKTVGGVKYYGSWSATKSVRTKG